MIGIILLISIPITNLLANIVATWLEPILKTRKRVVVFLFIIFSLVGGFFLDRFKISDEIKNSFNQYTNGYTNEGEGTPLVENLSPERPLKVDTTYHQNPGSQIVTPPKPKSTVNNPKKVLAFQQPLGVKIFGWMLILALPILLFFSIRSFILAEKNYAIAKGYNYGLLEWLWNWNDKYGDLRNKRKYNKIGDDYHGSGWLCFLFFWILIIAMISTYKNFTPSLYAIDIMRHYYILITDFFASLWGTLLKTVNNLLTPLFY